MAPWGCCDHVGPTPVGMVGPGFSAWIRDVLPRFALSIPCNLGWHPTCTYTLGSRGFDAEPPRDPRRAIPGVVGTPLAMVGSAGREAPARRFATSETHRPTRAVQTRPLTRAGPCLHCPAVAGHQRTRVRRTLAVPTSKGRGVAHWTHQRATGSPLSRHPPTTPGAPVS